MLVIWNKYPIFITFFKCNKSTTLTFREQQSVTSKQCQAIDWQAKGKRSQCVWSQGPMEGKSYCCCGNQHHYSWPDTKEMEGDGGEALQCFWRLIVEGREMSLRRYKSEWEEGREKVLNCCFHWLRQLSASKLSNWRINCQRRRESTRRMQNDRRRLKEVRGTDRERQQKWLQIKRKGKLHEGTRGGTR